MSGMAHVADFSRSASAWVGAGSKGFDLIRIYAIGAVVAFFFLWVGNIWVEPGSVDYINIAQAMLSGTDLRDNPPNGFSGRDIGVALIWIASGFPLTGSLTGFIIIQVAMGLAIPIFCYLAIRPWFPKTAYYTSIAAILSLSPILLSKYIHHDQPYIFFTVMSLYFVNKYVFTRDSRYVYLLMISVFAVGITRQAGWGLFWVLMPICLFFGGPKSYKHVILACLIFVGAGFLNSKYRYSLMGEVGVPGVQIFQNLYVNTSEFGVRLSADMGPNVRLILERMYECSLPSPAESKYVKKLKNFNMPPDFIQEQFSDYSASELVERIATKSHLGYASYIMDSGCLAASPAALGQVLLSASFEIAKSQPTYVVRLFLRNSLRLLYNPGWLHNTFGTEPQFQGGLLFPFGDNTTAQEGGNIGDPRLPELAFREASFIPLERQPAFITFYYQIYDAWYRSYHPITIILGSLSGVTWILMVIGLLQRAVSSRTVLPLPARVAEAASGPTVLLLANVAITAIADEPRYRYDFSLLMLKFTVAGIGCAIVIQLIMNLIEFWRIRFARR